MMLEGHFNTNLDLSYNFRLPKVGVKDATIGVTLYNLFSAKYDNNGWAAPAFTKENGKVISLRVGVTPTSMRLALRRRHPSTSWLICR